MKEFYVYEYRYPDTKMPFYVGKGCGKRYKDHLYGSSNRYVKSVINKLKRKGLSPEIERVFFTDSEDVALGVEEHLIRSYGIRDEGGLLCNFSIGGKGNKKYKFSEESMLLLGKVNDQVIADIEGCCRETVGYTRRGLGIPKCPDKPNYSPPPDMGGWNKKEVPDHVIDMLREKPMHVVTKETGISKTTLIRISYYVGIRDAMDRVKNKDLTNERIYTFVNDSGEIFEGHRYAFASKLRLPVGDLYNLLNGRDKTCKGWRILNE